MSQEEVADYFDAIWVYKIEGRKDGRDYMRNYNEAVAQHGIATLNETVDQAHEFAAFAIWHSMIVREFEIALQSINPNVYVPYWDWTVGDDPDANPHDSVIFSDAYFGDSAGMDENYIVNSSRMAYFPVCDDPLNVTGVWWQSPKGYLRGPNNKNASPFVSRHRGTENTLPTSADFDLCLNQQNYSSFWACTWGSPQSMAYQSKVHAGPHEWAGGSWYNDTTQEEYMGDVLDFDTSPNDPLWWSHHAQLDRLHYYWMQSIGDSLATSDDPCGGYYGGVTSYPQPPGHNLWDQFSPPFYAYRTLEEIKTLGPMNVSEACYFLSPQRCEYSYPEYSNLANDDYYGYFDDDIDRLPTVEPTNVPTSKPNPRGSHPTFYPTAKPNSNHHAHQRNSLLDGLISRASTLSSYVTSTSHKWRSVMISAGVAASLGLVVAVLTGFTIYRNDQDDEDAAPGRQGGDRMAYDALPTEDPI